MNEDEAKELKMPSGYLKFEEGIKTHKVFRRFKNILPKWRKHILFIRLDYLFEVEKSLTNREREFRSSPQYKKYKDCIIRNGLVYPAKGYAPHTGPRLLDGMIRCHILREMDVEYMPVFLIGKDDLIFKHMYKEDENKECYMEIYKPIKPSQK